LIRGCVRGEVIENEPLARHTSLKVGGPADIFIIPVDLVDLQTLLIALAETDIPWMVIGGGYNLLVRDGGYRGVVISLKEIAFLEQLGGNRIVAGAGVTTGALVRFAVERCLAGLEFLIGIPGTVGGALSVNAGAHDEAIMNRVENLVTVRGGEVTTKQRAELDYGYRHLSLAAGETIVSATLQLSGGSAIEIEGRIESLLAHRRHAQRVGHANAGSFFKNPEGKQAWRLIEEAGLKGYRIGGAQVAEEHGNFLVNRGEARAADFIELSGIIKDKVREHSGIILEEEVRIVGEE